MAKGFAATMKEFFGNPPIGSKYTPDFKGFAEELKSLTEKDREDFRSMLIAEGYELTN